jgi:hypothetical protein
MTQDTDRLEGSIVTLNNACNNARQKPLVSRRRIEHLKALAYDCGLTSEEARKYGKLTATKTWEALLSAHGLEFDSKSEINGDRVAPGNSGQTQSINLLEWVNLLQLLAVLAATAGLVVLLLNLWPRINPFNLFPQVKITIQVGKK